MRKLQIPCEMQGGGVINVDFFVFAPSPDYNPIHHQSMFYSKKGVVTPKNIMNNLKDLYDIARSNNLDFMEVLDYTYKSTSLR